MFNKNNMKLSLNSTLDFYNSNPIKFIIYVFVLITCMSVVLYFISAFDKVVLVNKTYTIYEKNGKGLMFEDSNGNVYKVRNVWFKGEFNSMENWNKLGAGKQVRIQGYSYRIPILGMYPIIYNVESG